MATSDQHSVEITSHATSTGRKGPGSDFPPQQHWALAMGLFMLAGIAELLAFGHLGAFTPLYLRQMGVTGEAIGRWTGVLASAAFILGIPLAPFWGVWADKYSRKLIIVRSAYIEAIIFAIAALSQTPWQLLLARVLAGFVLGNTGVQMALQSAITPRHRLGFAIGMISAAPVLGTTLGPALGGLVIAHWNIRVLLGIDAALTLLAGVAMTLLLREPHHAQRSEERVSVLLRRAVTSVARSPLVARLFFASFLLLLGAQLCYPYVPLLLQMLYKPLVPTQTAGLATMIGWVLSVAGAAGALATPLWGRWGDRFGHVRVLIIATVCTALTLVAQYLAPTLLTFAAARTAYGAVQVALSALTFAALATNVPETQRASILNLGLFPFYIAAVLAPSTATLLLPLGIATLFLVAAVVSLLALPVLLSIPATEG